MGSIYDARWKKAVEFINKVNAAIDQGYLVFDEDMNRVTIRFEIIDEDRGEEIVQRNEGCIFCYMCNNKEWDEGLLVSHEEWLKQNIFDKWKMTTEKITLRSI